MNPFILYFSLDILLIINMLLAISIIFWERKNPGATWAWLMVVLLLPYLGFIMYLWIGAETKGRKAFVIKSQMDLELFNSYAKTSTYTDNIQDTLSKYSSQELVFEGPRWNNFNELVFMNFAAGLSFLCHDNEVDIFHDGNSKFDKLFEDIERAQSFIHLQYYIVRGDELGQRLIALLAKKAKEGVEVRFLVDCMGKPPRYKKLFAQLIRAGGSVRIFLPRYIVRVNYRNHRKIVVIDGTLGYIGGINVGVEYLGRGNRFNNWRDAHIRVCGGSTKELGLRFIMDWNYAQNAQQHIPLSEKYFPHTEDYSGSVKMQIVSSGPDTRWANIRDGYIKMITGAKHRVYIQTPYFVPDDAIFETLKIAALSGIDVRIMIPANADHPFVYWAALSYLDTLADAGVKCYKYHNGFVHSKLVMVDGLVTSVGTANVDIRSFKLNFEVNAFIYDEEKTAEFETQFLRDVEDCVLMDREFFERRGRWSKIREAVSRLLSPLL